MVHLSGRVRGGRETSPRGVVHRGPGGEGDVSEGGGPPRTRGDRRGPEANIAGERSAAGQGSPAAPRSIAGGFVLVPVAGLMGAWRACRSAPLGIGDFRAWLACREMTARRCVLDEGRAPTYTFAELARLSGVSEKRARASVARLAAAGHLDWSESAIGFPDRPGQLDEDLVDTIGRGRGVVAIPRRMLRLLAGGARPALIATALGLLLRCLSRRKGGFDGRGRVKASWIARVFDVDVRRVKAARKDLGDLGWIEPEPAEQWALNRWGRAYRINLGWDRADVDGRRLPPPAAVDGPRLPPPDSNREPLPGREKNQEPARRGPAGVEPKGSGEGNRPLMAPNLDDVRPEDLRDVDRTLRLFDQAVGRNLLGPSEADRLRFLAVAEHARAVGTANPCGLFARLVRRGWWHFATQDDEDAARRRLREHLHGRPRPTERPTPPARSTVLDRPPPGPSMLGELLGRWAIPTTP